MLDQRGIRIAIRNRLLQTAKPGSLPDPDTNFAWENVEFKPPTIDKSKIFSSIWIRENFMWGHEPQIAYGYVEMIGVVQYDVVSPAGGGTADAEDMVKAIGDALKHGTGMQTVGPSGQSVQVSILRSEPAASFRWPSHDGPWQAFPVRTTFRAYGTLS